MAFTEEMRRWLADNRGSYEVYLLHAMMHDRARRASLTGVPLGFLDFESDECGVLYKALELAHRISMVSGKEMPTPPSPDFLVTYIKTAAEKEDMGDETAAAALTLARKLQTGLLKENWIHIDPYFQPWFLMVRGKRIARTILSDRVPDVVAAMSEIQRSQAMAAAVTMVEEDEMDDVIHGTSEDRIQRRSTGIIGMDDSLNGGWGGGECYLLFGGTGGGKSIAAGQCAWHEMNTNGSPLIVSTELRAREYVARIVSCAASVPIDVVQDAANFQQIRHLVSTSQKIAPEKLTQVEHVLDRIASQFRVAKIGSEDGMESRIVLEREFERYNSKYGRYPSWVCLDWLGSIADVGGAAGERRSSERAAVWEASANGCVKFAEDSGVPVLVLAQAVNDAHKKAVLSLDDIAISKGIARNMVAAIGVTNKMDDGAVKAHLMGEGEMPTIPYLRDQYFCVVKARKGEGRFVPVRRDFLYQRFSVRPRLQRQ